MCNKTGQIRYTIVAVTLAILKMSSHGALTLGTAYFKTMVFSH